MREEEKLKHLLEIGFTATYSGEVVSAKNKIVGSVNSKGYYQIDFAKDKKKYKVYSHRFIWFYFNREIPDIIDHINGITTDNQLANLRNVNHQKNLFNTKAKGYYLQKKTNKWLAEIQVNKERIYLGIFDCEMKARQAYLQAKEIYHIID